MPSQAPDWKRHVSELLQLIASEDGQLAYERDVPYVDIRVELLCMWFDDTYHPDDGLFAACFTADERSALARFHAFYAERRRGLPDSEGTVRTWLASPVWREIMKEASATLEMIRPQSSESLGGAP